MGETVCRSVPALGSPLIVDWPSQNRTDLEQAMRGGLAVVAWDCQKLVLLPDCRGQAAYEYLATNKKEDSIQLADADEIRANLPASGASLAAGLERGATLDVAIITVGKRISTRSSAGVSDLRGTCAGATHFVRGAHVGAFATKGGTRGKLEASATLFSASQSASSESKRDAVHRDGDTETCAGATSALTEPPAGCSALVRLELKALDHPASASALSEALSCPEGLVFRNGVCERRQNGRPYLCGGDRTECRQQCTLGSLESCDRLATMFHYGYGGPQDVLEAQRLYDYACQAGVADACAGLGAMLNGSNVPVGSIPIDIKRCVALTRYACDAGSARGCANLASMLIAGHGDMAKAAALMKQSCSAGFPPACGKLALLYQTGPAQGAPVVADLLLRACSGGWMPSCKQLLEARLAGQATDADAASARGILERSCQQQQAACAWLGVCYQFGLGAERDVPRAQQLFARSCSADPATAVACAGNRGDLRIESSRFIYAGMLSPLIEGSPPPR